MISKSLPKALVLKTVYREMGQIESCPNMLKLLQNKLD